MKTTLKEFWENNNPDGYYAVWKSGLIETSNDGFHFGFSGCVALYTDKNGFEDYPDWMDNTDESEMSVILLEALPVIHEGF